MQGSVEMLQSKPLGDCGTEVACFRLLAKQQAANALTALLILSEFLSRLVSTHLDRQSSSCLPRHQLPTARHASFPKTFKTHTFNKVVRFMKGNHVVFNRHALVQLSFNSPQRQLIHLTHSQALFNMLSVL